MDNIELETVNDINYELFNPEQLKWHKLAKSFAAQIPLDEVIASDKNNQFRRDLFEIACDKGFGALPFDKTYGGTGGDYVSFCLINEEFARHCVPIMSSLGVHVLCQEAIYKFGSQEQKTKYLSACASGKLLAAFALTEPAAGSDTAALETTAKLTENEYILNGSKIFITSGSVADIYIVFTRLNDSTAAFIVERDFQGLSIGQKFDMLGMRGYGTCEIVFNECVVPKANILGEAGMGRKVALSSLSKGRVTIAAQAIGWARGALDGLSKLSKEGGNYYINGNDHIIEGLLVNIEAASALTYQAAQVIDRGESNVTLAAMAKLKATDTAMSAADQVLTLVGIEGAKPKYLIERIFRDAKAGQIYEGTNQIQRMLIARDILSV